MQMTTKKWFSQMILCVAAVLCLGLMATALYFARDRSPSEQSLATFPSPTKEPTANYFSLPIHFEKKKGQTNAIIQYVSKDNGYIFMMTYEASSNETIDDKRLAKLHQDEPQLLNP